MRLVYMGTPQFAVGPLRALAEAGHDIAGVVTRTDKPAGRGRTLAAPPVKIAAMELGITLMQPKRVRDPEFIGALRAMGPDAIIVAAYGQILPKEILVLPKFGCVNIHASLLPAYRGAAPVNWAIIRGEQRTGDTIMLMDEGMDTGPILMQESVTIGPEETAGALTERLSSLGAKLIKAAMPLLESGEITPIAQDGTKATMAPLLKKEDGLIEWGLSALEIHNRVRGLSPWPGAYCYLDGKLVKIISTTVLEGSGQPGMLYERSSAGLTAGTGNGLLGILSIQPEGKKPMSAGEFLRGHRGIAGKKFASS
jgi:methionyl-tRNA formyltransferase